MKCFNIFVGGPGKTAVAARLPLQELLYVSIGRLRTIDTSKINAPEFQPGPPHELYSWDQQIM